MPRRMSKHPTFDTSRPGHTNSRGLLLLNKALIKHHQLTIVLVMLPLRHCLKLEYLPAKSIYILISFH